MCGKLLKLVIVVYLVIFSLQYNLLAEDTDSAVTKKNEDSSGVQEAINRDKDLLKQLMLMNQQPRTPDPEIRGVEFEINGNPIEGSSSAKLIMVQFSDYSCGHCALYTKNTYPVIHTNYIERGMLRYVVIDYPFPENLPAVNASEAAHCASDQGKYWEMHEEIYFDPGSMDDINSIAASVNLDMDKFQACMDSRKYETVIKENIELGTKLKIPSVPNFVIARIDPGNPKKVKGITYIRGAKPYEYFQKEINKALADIKE